MNNEVSLMLQENEERKQKLFPTFDQITGEGCPGDRVWIDITDLTSEGVHWYVPRPLIEQDELWRNLAIVKSIRNLCMVIYGRYNNDLRNTLIPFVLQARAKHDYLYFAEAYWRIRPKDFGDDIPFRLRAIQVELLMEMEEQRLAGKPIRVIVLKARQLGVSTFVDSYMGWYQIMWEKSKDSLIVGHQSDSTVEVEDMYTKAINALPDFLFYEMGKKYEYAGKPKITGSKTRNISHIPARNCKIKMGSSVNPESARGGSSALIHYTEVAFWQETAKLNPRNIIKAATSATGGKPGTMVIIESTPNGQNFFKDECDRAVAVDDYGNKLSSFTLCFITWWKTKLYFIQLPTSHATSGSASTHATSGSPADELPTLAEFAQQLIERREDKKNGWAYLYWLWTIGATLEGIYWYMVTRKDYQSDDDMQQEFPSDPIEAFKYSGTLEYDLYLCEKRKKTCKPAVFIGDICGDAPKGIEAMRNLRLYEDTAGCLKIWERPNKLGIYRNRYLVSVDIGGKYATSDYSVITVFDRLGQMLNDEGELDEQGGPTVVAEWYGHTDPDLLAIKCAQIAAYYDNALLVVENNTAYSRYNGTANDDVTELFFPILIPLYDNIYSHNKSELNKVDNQAETKYGFNTNRSTKVSVVKYLGTCLRDNLYIEREKGAINEMQTFMKFPNGTYGAVPGKHDDRVMSRAIGLYVSRFDWKRFPVRRRHTRQQRQDINTRINKRANAVTNTIFSNH